MSLWSEVRERLRSLVFRDLEERELEEEMRFHLEEETRKNEREGLNPAEARRRALVAFGGVDRFTEKVREERGTLLLESWVTDFKRAARALTREPAFTAVIVVTLTLAIGANAAIFSLIKAVLLKPLSFPDADRLIYIAGTAPGTDQPTEFGVPIELYLEYRDHVSTFEDAGLYIWGSATARAEENTEQLFLSQATPSLFTTLGVTPLLGRLPVDADEDNVMLLSHWLWEAWFGSNPGVLGKSYFFAGRMRTVIGVMRAEFRFPDERIAFWIPRHIRPADIRPGSGGFSASMVARVAPGTDRSELVARLQPFAQSVEKRLGGPEPYAQIMRQHRPVVRSLREQLVGRVATSLWILASAVGIVFLIACANLANLFAVRAESRRHDFAVRRTLGAGRASLIRSQMAEAVLLAASGGVGGALFAWAAIPILVRMAPAFVAGGPLGGAGPSDFMSAPPIPGLATAGLDLTTVVFTAGAAVVAASVFGLLPAMRLSGAGLDSIQQEGRSIVGRRSLMRDGLVILQVASAVILLVGSALLVRSFWHLDHVDPGFDTKGIFTFRVAADREDLKDAPSISQFQHALMDRLAALPDVESVGYVTFLPLAEGGLNGFITTSRIEASKAEPLSIRAVGVGGAYFQAMGIQLLRGRFFEPEEEQQAGPSAIISLSAANSLFPNEDPLGQQFRPVRGANTWYLDKSFTVIGVVEDVLLDDFRRETPEPIVYAPVVSPFPTYVVRSARADQLAPDVRSLIREVVPKSPMSSAATMERLASNTMASLSFTMFIVSIAALLALILGVVGIYGVVSYVVAGQTREIAVRMALGEQASTIRRRVAFQGGRVAFIGIALGLLMALGATRFLKTLLFRVQPLDASIFAAIAIVMLFIALAASYMPARRASAIDPLRALQSE